MGRDAGFLALNGAIASGAEAAIIPEFSTEVDQLEEFIKNGFRKSKNNSIVLVAESELTGGAMHYAERVKTNIPNTTYASQSSDTCSVAAVPRHDRILASRLGLPQSTPSWKDNVKCDDRYRTMMKWFMYLHESHQNDKADQERLVNVLGTFHLIKSR